MSVTLLGPNDIWSAGLSDSQDAERLDDLGSNGSWAPRLNGHDPAWIKAICEGLKHRPHILKHTNAVGITDGILPLTLVESRLFGRFLVSLPYLNTGGVWASNQSAAHALIARACHLADEFDVRYLELRHEQPLEHAQLNAARTDKVHMRLQLPATDEQLQNSFKSKLRSQIKKAASHDLRIQWGGHELLDQFYTVFSTNMRDLGTPVYSRGLFAAVLNAFEGQAELCVVTLTGRPVAAGLLVHRRGVTEVPSASSLRDANSSGANMWMYRQMLARAIEHGSQVFDFGRSSFESGTYKFKAQWGAVPQPAHWQYYVRKGSPAQMNPQAAGNQRLIRIWKKMPVSLTRFIGPSIVRGIP